MGSLPNRVLWHFISGSAILRPEEVITRELNKNKDRLLAGLGSYAKQRQPAGEQLSVDKKLEGRQLEFVQKLARFLGLEELLCYELFLSFLAYEYRNSKKALQHFLSSDRHSQVLMYRIRDFYFTERLYLLSCLKQVLSFGPDSHHPYKNVYSNFLADLLANHRLIHSIQDQYEDCCDTPLPTSSTHGILMTERQRAIWARQNLLEQCELLELMVIYFKDYEPDVTKFILLFEKFKLQGFAKYQTYKRILDESTEDLVKRLGYLQLLVILDCLDFELVQRCQLDGRFDGHPLLKDKHTFKKLDKLMSDMGSLVVHGPLLLGWVVIRQLHLEGQEDIISRKMGATALKLNCFTCLSDLLNMEPFNGKSIVAGVSTYLVYMVLCSVLQVFHEDRLGDNKSLNRLMELVLKKEFVADDVWDKGLEEGLGLLYHGALSKFPMEFAPFVQYSISMATAGEQSAKSVLTHLQKLQVYTEFLDRNSMQDLCCVDDALWRLTRNKMPYGTGGGYSLVIPQNTIGMLYRPDKGSPIIQWSWTYNGWNLFMCEMEQLLQQLSHGAGMVSVNQISKVTLVMKLIKAVLTSDPSSVDQLEGSNNLIFKLIQRCARLSSPPLELIANALDCLTCVAEKHPMEVWHGLKQTGLLPFLTENLDDMTEVLSGQGLQAGLYGALLAVQECSEGSYPVTQSCLAFLAGMVKPLRKKGCAEELLGSVLFILRQVFPVFHKWRYYDKGRREVIGQNCLDLFHGILDFLAEEKPQAGGKNKPTVQAVCVHCLLYTEAGQALLELVATGVDYIDVALSEQTSTFEGPGIELIHLTQLAFSVLNRLLLLKSPDLPMSPVEHALSSQPAGRQHRHIVVTVAQYIYHRHDPRLPTIATLLLKRLAVISPMSILACLGDTAEPIRDMYLLRLQAATEAVRLKVCILELLTACVDTQPGLIELFLNIQPKAAADGKKDLSLGKFSCLQAVLDLIEEKRQGTYQCPPVLLCACLQFIHALWTGQRETAMAVLRSRASFWPNVVAPLMRDLPDKVDFSDEVVICMMKTFGFAMKILAQEFYSVPRSKLDKSLHKVLKEVNEKERLFYWSMIVREAMIQEGTESSVIVETLDDNPTLKLLSSWKSFLITMTAQSIEELQVNEALTEQILSDIMAGLQAQFNGELSPLNIKLASLCSAVYCTLMKPLGRSVKKVSPMLKEIELALLQTCTNFQTLLPSVRIGLLGSATALLQRVRRDSSLQVAPEVLTSLLVVLSPLVQQSTRQCAPTDPPPSTQGETPPNTAMEDKIKLQVIALSLMQEIIQMMGESDQWLPILQQNTVISSLLVSLQLWMKAKQGVQYVESALRLLFVISDSKKGAECICMNGLTEYTCLSISTVYQNEDPLSQVSNLNRLGGEVGGEEASWAGVYCLCIDLYTSMLSTLRYSFLKDALDFVGVHQDRLQLALEMSRSTMHEKVWKEAKKTCTFVFQLSHFSREWRLELPGVLDKLLTSMSYMFQSFTSLLIRPRYLQHLLERQSRCNGWGAGSELSLSRPPSLQTQSSDDLDQPSPQLRPVQQLLLEILAEGLSTLRHFTPGLCEIMLDLSLDISEYPPFLGLSFSTPSGELDSAPTFGTLLSAVTVCVSMLTKMEPRVISPHKSPSDQSQPTYPTKSLVQFVMENCLYLVLSQACRYLKEPELAARDKQLLKRELGTELNCFLTSYHRYLKRGSPPSPGGTNLISPGTAPSRSGVSISRSMSTSTFTSAQDQAFCKLVEAFVRKVLG